MVRTIPHSLVRIVVFLVSCLYFPAYGSTYTYDFAWWSGAAKPWVYEAGSLVTVDVFDAPETPENDVYFRFRNGINTELGYLSSIPYLQIDTGAYASMFKSFEIGEFDGYVS